MDTINIDTQTADATPIDAAPRPAKQRKRRWWRRNDRKGLGSTELTILILVIVIVGLLAGLGLSRIISARQSADHSALQTNMDTVSFFADAYWQQHAADSVGRRKISPMSMCQYINAQLTGEDVILRTMQYVDNTGNLTAIPASATALDLVDTEDIAGQDRGDDVKATCAEEGADLNDAYADLLVKSNATGLAISASNTPSHSPALTFTDANNTDPEVRAAERAQVLEDVGMVSIKTVWIAFPGTAGEGGTNGFAPSNVNDANLPQGTDGTFLADNDDHGKGVEYMLIGGVSPDGASFCMVKVFDAADNANVGTYYKSAAAPEAAAHQNGFVTCLDGITGADRNGYPALVE